MGQLEGKEELQEKEVVPVAGTAIKDEAKQESGTPVAGDEQKKEKKVLPGAELNSYRDVYAVNGRINDLNHTLSEMEELSETAPAEWMETAVKILSQVQGVHDAEALAKHVYSEYLKCKKK